ncbi:hypothetical protein R6Q57_024451 [Mikania cordata]
MFLAPISSGCFTQTCDMSAGARVERRSTRSVRAASIVDATLAAAPKRPPRRRVLVRPSASVEMVAPVSLVHLDSVRSCSS